MKTRNTPFYTITLVCLSALLFITGREEKKVTVSPVVSMPSDGLISWEAERKLTWDDYKGEPDPNVDAAASTTTLLTVSYQFHKNGFTFSIRSGFDPNRSWGTHRTPYILSHEQGHFDIAEVYARKLYQRLSEYKYDEKHYRRDLKKIYDDIITEKEKAQDDYDKETRHSILRVRQAEWLKKIKEMLEDGKEYAGYQNRP